MVEIKEIQDSKSLAQWLVGQRSEGAETISQRIAMRELPSYWRWVLSMSSPARNKSKVISIMWWHLVSGMRVAGVASEDLNVFKDLQSTAAISSFQETDYDPVQGDAIFASASEGGGSSHVTIYFASAIEHAIDQFQFSGDTDEFWELIRSECELLGSPTQLDGVALWQDFVVPIACQWETLVPLLEKDEVDWSFWVKWYEAALAGEPLNFEILKQIALIPFEDWKQGPRHVNGLIAEIEEEFLLALTPVAEKIELTPATQRLRIVPERMSQKALYSNLLEVIQDGMTDLRDNPQFDNALSALGPVFEKVLDRTFDKYLGSPQRVHDDFVKAKRRIQKLLDVGELAPNDEVVEFVDDLDAGAAHIRANMPQVRDSMAALAALRIAEASDADIEGIRAGAEAIAAQSEPEMAEEMCVDAAELVASRNVPMGAPKLLAPDVAYRLGHRIVESKQVLTKANVVKAGAASTATFTGSQMIIEAVRVILRLFGV